MAKEKISDNDLDHINGGVSSGGDSDPEFFAVDGEKKDQGELFLELRIARAKSTDGELPEQLTQLRAQSDATRASMDEKYLAAKKLLNKQ